MREFSPEKFLVLPSPSSKRSSDMEKVRKETEQKNKGREYSRKTKNLHQIWLIDYNLHSYFNRRLIFVHFQSSLQITTLETYLGVQEFNAPPTSNSESYCCHTM